ncbi:hypothetical protein AVEN_105215-1 [Araneus ventricosus]|uniref:Uncharacterized protein n=1 Tax=Araneus ventricosus TaxID=182803 RepID=A0A4Y2U1D7_ARAVE|nr:hypothetical protein AVEN_105215-1 [Araneus ventricosus]
MESNKTKYEAVSAPIETKQAGIQTISVSVHPSNPTKIQAPIEYKEASTQTFSTGFPPQTHSQHKEQGNTARQNPTFAGAFRKENPRLSFCAQKVLLRTRLQFRRSSRKNFTNLISTFRTSRRYKTKD